MKKVTELHREEDRISLQKLREEVAEQLKSVLNTEQESHKHKVSTSNIL